MCVRARGKDAVAVAVHRVHFASIPLCICIKVHLRHTRTHIYANREAEVSNPRGDNMSGGELEPVHGESVGISPLAAQRSRQQQQQHKPGQA